MKHSFKSLNTYAQYLSSLNKMIKLYHKVDTNPSSKLQKIQSIHMVQIQVTSIQLEDNAFTQRGHNTIQTSKVYLFLKNCIQSTSASSSHTFQLTLKGESLALFIAKTDPRGNPPLTKGVQLIGV